MENYHVVELCDNEQMMCEDDFALVVQVDVANRNNSGKHWQVMLPLLEMVDNKGDCCFVLPASSSLQQALTLIPPSSAA